jgi:glycosyltransferase involved in cell wall biosynthesis
MLKVSVIIPNYNYGRFLDRAVDSVLNQSIKPDEIIVVDDGSTDDSLEVLRSFGDAVTIVEQSNAGVATARNKGAEIAAGELLAFLDADDYWYTEKLEKQLERFSDPDIGFVHCGVTNVDESGNKIDDYLAGREGWVGDALLKFQPAVLANTLIVRRAEFEKIDGFDTTPELHPSEDWDLCYRLSRVCKLGFVREPLLYYRHHGRGGHTNIARMERAMLIAFEKAFGDPADEIQSLRREAYGNLFLVLAGSYYHSGQIMKSVNCGVKAIAENPRSAGRLLGLPFRSANRILNRRS